MEVWKDTLDSKVHNWRQVCARVRVKYENTKTKTKLKYGLEIEKEKIMEKVLHTPGRGANYFRNSHLKLS